MSRNEEYYRRYENICSLILKAYHDLYLIQTIDEIKPTRISVGGSVLHVLSHICELAKADLALIIWKIFLDNDGKSNTLNTLNAFLRTQCDVNSIMKNSLSCSFVEKDIRTIRKQMLAHNDIKKEPVKINVADMSKALFELRDKLNALCFPDIDERVCRIEDANLNVLAFHVKWAFGLLVESTENFLQSDESAVSKG